MCMIVKDEQDCLERCLNSAANLFRELVIVDTGSTDSTVDIAKRYTDKIFYHAWENDFSKARNQSLSYATEDWVFIMDADEELEEQAYDKLKKIFIDSTPAARTYFLCLVNVFSTSENKQSSLYHPRFFNFQQRDFHYQSIVHNTPMYKHPVEYVDLKLYHYGYSSAIKEKVIQKSHRTLSLLQKKLSDNPDNYLDLYHIIKSYNALQMYDNTMQTAERIFELYGEQRSTGEVPGYMHRFAVEIAGSFYFTACCFQDCKQKYLDDMDRIFPAFPNAIDVYFNCACLSLDFNDTSAFESYVRNYKRCWELFEQQKEEEYWKQVELIHRFDMDKIEYLVGIHQESTGHPDKAVMHYQEALTQSTSNTLAGVGMLRIGINRGKKDFLEMLAQIRSFYTDSTEVESEFINYLYEHKPPEFVEYMACVMAASEFRQGFSPEEETELIRTHTPLKTVVFINNLYSGKDTDIFSVLDGLGHCRNLKARLILAWAACDKERLCDERLEPHVVFDEYRFYGIFYESQDPNADTHALEQKLSEINFFSLSPMNRLNYRKLKVDLLLRSGREADGYDEMEKYLSELYDYSMKVFVSGNKDMDPVDRLCTAETPNMRFAGHHRKWLTFVEKGDKKNAVQQGSLALENATDLTREYAAYLKDRIQTRLV